MRLRTVSSIIASALACSVVPAGCGSARTTDDPSLHPPGAPAGVAGETVIRDLARFDLVTAYPKRFLEQHLAFTASCDASSRSPDAGAAGDARLFFKLVSDARSPEDFASSLQGKFELVQVSVADASQSKASEGMMTGYATPEFAVRSKPDERFRFPLFGDLRKSHPELTDKTRREILAVDSARADAIAWIDDPLAWALIETNGTARLRFADSGVDKGKPRREIFISRVATNGRPWTSIGRWLANRGLVDSAEYTFADVAKAAETHPDKAEEAALDNERVVFFAEVPERDFPPTVGLPGGKLMSGYSCAADQSIYPPGSILAVVERGENIREPRAARFLFVHDAGGAIAGPGRVDVYFGEGTDALLRAGQTRTPVEVYRLRRR